MPLTVAVFAVAVFAVVAMMMGVVIVGCAVLLPVTVFDDTYCCDGEGDCAHTDWLLCFLLLIW